MTNPMSDRRFEKRHDAAKDIKIRVLLPNLVEIRGRVVDISPSGFRAEHKYSALSAGQKVEYELEGNEGSALVVWNRIFEEHVETGFFLLQN